MKINVVPKDSGLYPFIGKSEEHGIIVLFSRKDCGIVLDSGRSKYPIGEYTEDWDDSTFRRFQGTIELSND